MTENKKTENKTGTEITENKEQKASPDIRELSDEELEIVAGGRMIPQFSFPTIIS